jgi:hypothetical protein
MSKMVNTVGKVLKSSEVKLEGKFQLKIDADAAPAANAGSANSVALQVNIVENTAEFAIIEVTCSCGSKTRVKCQYNNQPAAAQGQD